MPSAGETWESGTRLGPYTLVSLIGRGGMGEVWKAHDTRLGRFVAIKRLTGEQNSRFAQEARAIAALNHPYICTLYDVGFSKGTPDYLVMEFVDGEQLVSPDKPGPLPVDDTLRFALQIAEALEEAHSKGIIHRDLKPGNIFRTRTGIKVLDFGMAKLTEDSDPDVTKSLEGVAMGTPAYMSPEQANGWTVDARSDLFSFGVILHEMLSGERPFSGRSTVEILSALLRDEPRPLQGPSALQSIVSRCLRKNPAERFQTAQELKAALQNAASNPQKDSAPNTLPSLAVLPFANMSGDKEQEFFSDGLSEEIINLLARLPGLKVIARTSAFAFKGQNTDIRRIAEVLGVTNILEGSVRRSGNRLRVTAQLIASADGSHLWSERYDRQMEDIFEMQDEIAAAIAAELKVKFLPDTQLRARRQPNLQAYEAYLRYRQHQWGFTRESLEHSRECLEQAIALDPEFALPYVGLADHFLSQTWAGALPSEVMPKVRRFALKALELDPELPEAHGMLGIVAGPYELDWNEAGRRFQLATAPEPVPWHVLGWYSYFYLLPLGRLEEACTVVRPTVDTDPHSQIRQWCLAIALEGTGQDEASRATFQKVVGLDPHFWLGWVTLGLHHAVRGEHAEARACAEKAFALYPSSPYTCGLLAGILRKLGETSRADELMTPWHNENGQGPIAFYCYHLALGETDGSMRWAPKALELRVPTFIGTFIRPFETRLRTSAGWPELLKKMNLSQTE